MLNLNQKDPLWGDIKIGQSASDLAGNGCLITSLCDLWTKFHYNPENRVFLRPDKAAKEWKYIAQPNDLNPRYLVWPSINGSGMKFVWRQFGWNPSQMIVDPVNGLKATMNEIAKTYTNHPEYGVVFRVVTKYGQHWIAGWKWGRFGLPVCYDPLGGKTLWKPWGFLGKYKACDGFAIVKGIK